METNDFLSYYSAWYDGWADELVRAVSDMAINSQAINDSMNEAAKKLVESMSGLFTEDYTKSLQASLSALVEKLGTLPINELQEESYILVPDEKLEPLREMAKFVPEEKQGEFQEIISPAKEKDKILTPANIIALLALICSIVSMLNSFKPQDMSEDSKNFFREEFGQIVSESGNTININVFFDSSCKHEDVAIEGTDVTRDLIVPDGQDKDADTQTESINVQE